MTPRRTDSAPSRRRARARKRTSLSSGEVRARLLEAALSEIRTRGYEATSVSDLTREIGVAKGTFFNHFPTKEALLLEWFSALWDEEVRALEAKGVGGTEAILGLALALRARMADDDALARALSARLHLLPVGAGAEGGGASGPAHPVDRSRAWVKARLQECLPVVVPIYPIPESDLSVLVTATLFDDLVTPEPTPPSRGSGSRPPIPLETRLRFLLESAGLQTT
jgi:AcrR family transcriptional regulator